MDVGQAQAKNIIYWDHMRLGDIGWSSAKAMNRAIGECLGYRYSLARGWVLALACCIIATGTGAIGYYSTLIIGFPFAKNKLTAEHSSDPNGDSVG